MLGLYLHIPFCGAICNYCNFNRGLFDADLKRQYVQALLDEIHLRARGTPADTIFFGGGTPSLLEPMEIAAIIHACRESFDLTSFVGLPAIAVAEAAWAIEIVGKQADLRRLVLTCV